MDKKTTISLTYNELFFFSHIIDHFSDYMAYDDRPDHGMGILKQYRDMSEEDKRTVFYMTGRLLRRRRKLQQMMYNKNNIQQA